MVLFSPPAAGSGEFFYDIYRENLVWLLEVKFTKMWGPPVLTDPKRVVDFSVGSAFYMLGQWQLPSSLSEEWKPEVYFCHSCFIYTIPLDHFWNPNTIYLFWPYHTACGISVPQPRIEPRPLAVKAQNPNH